MKQGCTAVLAVFLLWNACISSASADTLQGRPRVIDGDTLEVSGSRIRMSGIDAPESSQNCTSKSGKQYACGQVATTALIEKIGGSNVTCKTESIDKYGRSISTCFLSTTMEDLNGWMVRNGHAVAYRRYSTKYITAEDLASNEKKGIWAGSFQNPEVWRRESKSGAPAPQSPSSDKKGDGCPCPSCTPPIKGNISSSNEKIYHIPTGQFYSRVRIDESKGERYFCSVKDAEAAGWRASLR